MEELIFKQCKAYVKKKRGRSRGYGLISKMYLLSQLREIIDRRSSEVPRPDTNERIEENSVTRNAS
uniref:Transposase n=1 Tax=Heterorhabditis bacteriophora TaxID=37862 RepID=A0A1I7X4C5_HETBA